MGADVATAPDDMNDAAAALAGALRVVVLTGAGVSAESGIATFRGTASSLWSGITGKAGLLVFGLPWGWHVAPRLAWRAFMTHFYRPLAGAQPNAAHVALAELPLAIPRARVAIVTQNVDGLHQAAGSPPDSVHEIHGTVHAFMCTQHGHPAQLTPQELADDDAPAPRCRVQGCGSYLRPKAVLFTEGLPSERTPHAARWLRGEARRRATRRLTRARAPTLLGTGARTQPGGPRWPRPACSAPGTCAWLWARRARSSRQRPSPKQRAPTARS